MSPQMQADIALIRWQATRHSELSPEQRIEIAFLDFLIPPQISSNEYEAIQRRVSEEMAHV